jgi:ABC-type molybdenum transport system ATPase subunit/photorepair protein PhrA
VIVGGTIAGQFMPGLSGGQRKLLLFELIFQRTASQENLLIVLDEPFAGVTGEFYECSSGPNIYIELNTNSIATKQMTLSHSLWGA